MKRKITIRAEYQEDKFHLAWIVAQLEKMGLEKITIEVEEKKAVKRVTPISIYGATWRNK